MSDTNRPQDNPELDDLLADYHIVSARKSRQQEPTEPEKVRLQPVQTQKSASSAPRQDVPRKPDGTPYSIEELRQIQASRKAMYARQNAHRSDPSAEPRRPAASGNTAPQSVRSRQLGTRPSPSAAYEAAYRQHGNGTRPSYRHRKPGKPNGAILLFALLVLAVGAVSAGQIVQNRAAEKESEMHTLSPNAGTETGSSEDPAQTEEEDPIPEENLVLWNTTTVNNDQIHTGDLILVNYQYAYPAADTIAVQDVYSHKNTCYQVSSTNISLMPVTLAAMNAMTEEFYADTSSNDMIIVSGYRNVQSQQNIYDDRVASQGEEMAALYVATPGYSEHHTGLAMDLSFYTDDGKSVSIENYEHGSWINANCTKYGFVLRYPPDKVEITKIGYEFWHYRYVGLPHADIMTEKNLCLEEYMDYLRDYTTDTKLLWIQDNGTMADVSATALPKEGCLVYYVPAAEGETTEVRIPRGNIFENTRISGNNVDGFIVTVDIGS